MYWLRRWRSSCFARHEVRNTMMGLSFVWESRKYPNWLRLLKRVGEMLQLPGVTTHSLRSGGCTDLLEGGAPHELIKRQGRWRSDAYLQYWRPQPAELSTHLGAAFFAAEIQWDKLLSASSFVYSGILDRQTRARAIRLGRQARVSWTE
jgi:hypothetical protein